jgi:hypothetical protein
MRSRAAYSPFGIGHNSGGAVSGIGNAETGSIQGIVLSFVKGLWPQKTWAALIGVLGVGERVAKHRVAGTREFSADDMARLLWQEDGFFLLAAVMEAAPRRPVWWRMCRPLMDLADVERMQVAARKKLKAAVTEAIDDDQRLAGQVEGSRTAFALQDEEFYRPHLEAFVASARVQGRAVAAPKRREGR